MQRPSNAAIYAIFLASLALYMNAQVLILSAQERTENSEKVRPVTLRIGVPGKQTDRDVVFPMIVESSGAASVGRIRAELELSVAEGWTFRGIELTRGLDLRSSVKKRSEGATKLIIDWDLSGEGKELPTGHVALFRVQAAKTKSQTGPSPSDNPPALTLRKMSWGLAEFEKRPETLPQFETPDRENNNPDVGCFFFTH